jgi:hypothetical protein
MQFHFVRSQMVVFDTDGKIEEPEELVEAVPKMSVGSIFYHFIDARRRSPEMMDDFHTWVRSCGDHDLCSQVAAVRNSGDIIPIFMCFDQLGFLAFFLIYCYLPQRFMSKTSNKMTAFFV